MKRLVLLALLLWPAAARADIAALTAALEAPGTHAIMRHALAPGTGDPADFRLGDCSVQRNLDEAGREQARRIGAAMRKAGIAFDTVLTSEWCRCRETAELLGLGPVEALPALNSFFRNRDREAEQMAELRRHLASLPAQTRVLLVTHQVNVTALTGTFPSSGEVLAFRLDGADATVTADFLLDP